jgi:DNA modification methylase
MKKIIHGDSLEKIKELENNSIDAIVTDPPYGLSFMGKKWDYDVPTTELWAECLRVLKPGGYLLAFAGTRTQHRMAVRIEDAGFEIRDMIAWVYGSGFPKSLNIGKAVDKLQGNEREVTGKGNPMSSLGTMHDDDWKSDSEYMETKGTSEWEGWGTALKPALEPITVARKPLSEKTVAENVLKWGTGGINIDGSRVGTVGGETHKGGFAGSGIYGDSDGVETNKTQQGRFPANLIHDGSDEVVELFPNDSQRFFYQAKASKSERNKGCEDLELKRRSGLAGADNDKEVLDDVSERFRTLPSQNNHPTVKPIALMEYLVKLVTKENAVVLDPFAGSGSTLLACKNLGRGYVGIEREQEYVDIINARLK